MSKGNEFKLPRNLYWRDGSLWARFERNGVAHRKCLHTASVREAERKLQDLKAHVRAEEEAGEKVGFQEAAVEWEASYLTGLSKRGAHSPHFAQEPPRDTSPAPQRTSPFRSNP